MPILGVVSKSVACQWWISLAESASRQVKFCVVKVSITLPLVILFLIDLGKN